MSNTGNRPWRKRLTWILGCIAAAVLICVLVYFTERTPITPGDTIQIITLLVLVVATLWYAFSTARIHRATGEQAEATRQHADISRQSLDVALTSERNAVVPIIRLARGGTSSSLGKLQSVEVQYRNIGKGPALNLRAWLQYQTDASEEYERTAILPAEVVGVDEIQTLVWKLSSNTTVLPNSPSDYDIVFEYSDIYGQHFSSHLVISNVHESQFSFGSIQQRSYPY